MGGKKSSEVEYFSKRRLASICIMGYFGILGMSMLLCLLLKRPHFSIQSNQRGLLTVCGIAGIIDRTNPPDDAILTQMVDALVKRGPDDEGRLLHDAVGLVHRRLSIIDLAGGRQPILNEDETLALVCNGEVYDFSVLRERLENQGHQFRTHSDSEVILHLYEEKGPACLNDLNGMFAIAIVHLDSGKLFLARDRFGQKPLFYAEHEGRIAFASGPAPLKDLPWVDTTIDPTAIHDFLEYQYVPCPRSIYKGIKKLPPGWYAVWADGKLSATPYWQPILTADFKGTYEDAQAETRRLFKAAVNRRLVADVPLGTFLSGGMDSGLISAMAVQCGINDLSTFSIGFPEKKYDERKYAELTARHLGTDHHFLEVTPDSFSDLEEVVALYEEPFSDSSMLPTALLCQFTRQNITVALSGDAADELFGGYYRYKVIQAFQKLKTIPTRLRRPLAVALLKILPNSIEERTFFGKINRLIDLSRYDHLEQYLNLISRFPGTLRHSLYQDDVAETLSNYDGLSFLKANFTQRDTWIDSIVELECRTYLPEDILVKVDRASMGHALEVRSPFLDVELAEFAFSLPFSFKQKGSLRKRILCDAFSDLLPEQIFQRPKMGFGLPVAQWLREGWKEPCYDHLLNGEIAKKWFKRDRLEWKLQEHCDMRADYSYSLFALLVLELWAKNLKT